MGRAGFGGAIVRSTRQVDGMSPCGRDLALASNHLALHPTLPDVFPSANTKEPGRRIGAWAGPDARFGPVSDRDGIE
jgi:hypothetical protein